MRTYRVGWLLLALVVLPPCAGRAQDIDREAILASSKELNRALDLLQDALTIDAGPIRFNGLWKMAGDIAGELYYFQQQVKKKASKDDLAVAFDAVDRKVKAVVDLLEGGEMLTSGLKLAARRLSSADHDLHFLLSSKDDAPEKASQVVYRQTLALLALIDDLDKMVKWVYVNRDPLNGWVADVKATRSAVAEFQRLQQKKAAPDDLKKQFGAANQAWNKVMKRYNDAGADQYLLQNSMARVEQVFARLAPRFGIKDRPATVTVNFNP